MRREKENVMNSEGKEPTPKEKLKQSIFSYGLANKMEF